MELLHLTNVALGEATGKAASSSSGRGVVSIELPGGQRHALGSLTLGGTEQFTLDIVQTGAFLLRHTCAHPVSVTGYRTTTVVGGDPESDTDSDDSSDDGPALLGGGEGDEEIDSDEVGTDSDGGDMMDMMMDVDGDGDGDDKDVSSTSSDSDSDSDSDSSGIPDDLDSDDEVAEIEYDSEEADRELGLGKPDDGVDKGGTDEDSDDDSRSSGSDDDVDSDETEAIDLAAKSDAELAELAEAWAAKTQEADGLSKAELLAKLGALRDLDQREGGSSSDDEENDDEVDDGHDDGGSSSSDGEGLPVDALMAAGTTSEDEEEDEEPAPAPTPASAGKKRRREAPTQTPTKRAAKSAPEDGGGDKTPANKTPADKTPADKTPQSVSKTPEPSNSPSTQALKHEWRDAIVAALKREGPMTPSALGGKVNKPKGLSMKLKTLVAEYKDLLMLSGDRVSLK